MNQNRSLSRRALAIAASAFIGLVGAVAIASPASAHHPKVNGEAICDTETGEWVITWTVRNSETDLEGDLTAVTVDPHADFSTITVGATLPMSGEGPLEEVQRVPAEPEQASLEVSAHWIRNGDDIDETREAKVDLGGPCEREDQPAPVEVDSTSTCEGLTVNVNNPEKGEDVEVTLSPSTGDAVTEPLAAGESVEHSFDADEDGLTVEVGVDDEEFSVITWEEPADCDEDGGGGGDLPETGASTGIVVGGSMLLLALGGGLYVLARRRRITFTA